MAEALEHTEAMTSVYGEERGSAVLAWVRGVLRLKAPSLLGTDIRTVVAGGQRLALFSYPILFHASKVRVTLGMLFLHTFPEPGSVRLALIAPAPGDTFVTPHPFVTDGRIDTARVPGMPQDRLLPVDELVLVIQAALAAHPVMQHDVALHPFAQDPAFAPPAAAPTQGGQAPPPPPQQVPPPPHAAVSQPAAPETEPEPASEAECRAAAVRVWRDNARGYAEWVRDRKASVAAAGMAGYTREALAGLVHSLQAKEQVLVEERARLASVEAALDSALVQGPALAEDPQALVATAGPLHSQALSLLAEVHAADDAMLLLERRLKKGSITVERYVRGVSDAARRQFHAKYLLRKAHGRITADQSLETLTARFSQVEPALVRAVLVEYDYNFGAASKHLGEMCR